MKNTLIKIMSAAALAVAAVIVGGRASAAPFIPGNIVVLQEGDGSAGLSTTSAPVFLLEFFSSTASQAVPVQTISIPTTGGSRLTQSGGSASEGFITRSLNTGNVTFAGYDAGVGITNIPGSAATGTNRCWGQVDLNGNYTRGASGSTTAFSGSNIRSSVSDGTNNYWMSGTAGSSANQGIWYSANGGAWIQIITASPPNTRVTRIFNGKLYYSTSAAIFGFSGLPTTVTAVPPATGITSGSVYDFAINPAGNVAYVADDGALSGTGGIAKWTNSGSVWGKAFTFGSSANTASNNLTAGCRAGGGF